MARGIKRPRNSIASGVARTLAPTPSPWAGGGQNSIRSGVNAAFDAQGRYVPKPVAPAAPPAPAAAPQAAAPDPRDSGYSASVARLLAQRQQQRADVDLQGKQDKEDYDLTLQRMARAKGIDLLDTNHAANSQGLFYSGQLTKRRGDVEHDYSDRETDATTAFNRRADARQAALDQLGTVVADPNSPTGYTATGGAALDLGDIWNAAIQRRVDANQGLPADVPAPAAPPAAAPSKGYAEKAGTDSRGNRGTWHIYPDGRKVFVKG